MDDRSARMNLGWLTRRLKISAANAVFDILFLKIFFIDPAAFSSSSPPLPEIQRDIHGTGINSTTWLNLRSIRMMNDEGESSEVLSSWYTYRKCKVARAVSKLLKHQHFRLPFQFRRCIVEVAAANPAPTDSNIDLVQWSQNGKTMLLRLLILEWSEWFSCFTRWKIKLPDESTQQHS